MDRNSRAVLKRLNRSKFPWNVDRGVGSGNRVLVGGQDTHGKGHFWGTLMLGHAQTCPRSISSTSFARGQQRCGLRIPVYRSKLSLYASVWVYPDGSRCCVRLAFLHSVSVLQISDRFTFWPKRPTSKNVGTFPPRTLSTRKSPSKTFGPIPNLNPSLTLHSSRHPMYKWLAPFAGDV